MYIHKEGRKLLLWTAGSIMVLVGLMLVCVSYWTFFHYLFVTLLVFVWLFLMYFFRIPNRVFTHDGTRLISPADGTICAIEEVFEKEYLNCECLQISVFMYGTDVHVNRYPIAGKVEYVKYHKGNYFVASHPKSSSMNERSSIGMRLASGEHILLRQVAGVMARRIVCYAHEGEAVEQNQEMGFIKFGSRVDLFVPKDTEILVGLQDVVRNGITPLCILPSSQEPLK
ncbi:MAG: phosphatidylserine decarboxylase family protein [Bacteroidales bacterium]|nr:phosphatidylserine decarboxylase family protein [Bacteroidales bacterium]